ncbi:hypothetical protein [Moraxella sp. ZY210820]|uniref:hypothetical protein n=1 Tax=unclassified Moraxella TaxID=2685852 RepID=UPI00272FFA4F|nr:hypothetical protein [Moraxella sp. ZY210820]WLF84631.1 hypothetical protein LU301_03930 [Moraxella sp. ZY210820]
MQDLPNHEIVTLFETYLHPLNSKLVEMLNEHHTHQTERRGCGYTQATRFLADYINVPRSDTEFTDLNIFEDYDLTALKKIMNEASVYGLELNSWRNLDKNVGVLNYLADENHAEQDFYQALNKEVQFQQKLRQIRQYANLEESFLIIDFIEDLILPEQGEQWDLINVPNLDEKPKVGSCPMAENFFLKIAHGKILRQGRINIFVDDKNQPLIMEKIKMGDDHSCINLVPMIKNGVRLPIGCLFSTQYEDESLHGVDNKRAKGSIVPINSMQGFWFLRLTTLAVSPQNRERAFTTHFKQQIQNGLFNPGTTTVSQLMDVAMEQF